MKRAKSIKALLKKAAQQLEEITKEYNNSLHKKQIKPELKVEIKNLFENIRSVLDYLANEIRESSVVNNQGSKIFYFPILPDLTSFEKCINKWFPGLKDGNLDLYSYLLSIQPFQGQEQMWLKQFNDVNIGNKHVDLIEQTREEQECVDVDHIQGGGLSYNPKLAKFGKGARIFGSEVDQTTNMPFPNPSIQVKRILWVDFKFDSVNISALTLMQKSLKEIQKIVKHLSSKI
ncbi:MAG: hypothetical protein COV59_03255 [Candidatus Magasanikbacteria bacterium CG11_big_fil_rev_8_21_14_0_20_39_34]|uniref:Uncharacterized protein n=1 Tax=Candidatus Magasanikbacteria bacterium CG11_big_fil_rev_8_21_14_0_20_39_34 TaxID=1974653 RepID=A0A2H0N5K7_9BACT|nr:MAG: hypothetical protein COV59_03255 [Candidatus Magasanikbacteria bacterium CG11_big_fil_rev_8_21_14_0_20_39_34]